MARLDLHCKPIEFPLTCAEKDSIKILILAEKDILPASEALAKFEVFDRLLSKELGLS